MLSITRRSHVFSVHREDKVVSLSLYCVIFNRTGLTRRHVHAFQKGQNKKKMENMVSKCFTANVMNFSEVLNESSKFYHPSMSNRTSLVIS